jgi:hypothetical protein
MTISGQLPGTFTRNEGVPKPASMLPLLSKPRCCGVSSFAVREKRQTGFVYNEKYFPAIQGENAVRLL